MTFCSNLGVETLLKVLVNQGNVMTIVIMLDTFSFIHLTYRKERIELALKSNT